ncbi:hypothetical protein BKA70DRAFT_1222262 [Coprinopsis sp. MPI-PUGE-AT-0042]|nr:hypothetical protein BKA70DRAFT_1222262 [Coprinopsis sp. MPI-PUGE-AT-0042]
MSLNKDSSRPAKFHRRIQPGAGPRLIQTGAPRRARVIEAKATEVSDGDENMGEGSSSRASTDSSMSTESSNSSSDGATITFQIGTRVPGVYFTIKDYPIHKQFRRVMRKYAEDRGLDPSDKWVYYGDVVQPEDTPASLRMVEDPLPRIELIIYRKVTFPDPFSFPTRTLCGIGYVTPDLKRTVRSSKDKLECIWNGGMATLYRASISIDLLIGLALRLGRLESEDYPHGTDDWFEISVVAQMLAAAYESNMLPATSNCIVHADQRPTAFALRERILSAHLHLAHRVAYLLSMVHLPFSETRAMMKEQDVIISGSAALHVLMGCTWSVNDVDLYCGQGRVQPVTEFLQQHGYTLLAPAEIGEESAVTHEDTPVMNWIAFNGVVSLYPELTMELRGLTNGIRLGHWDTARAGVQKYVARGFLIEDRTLVGGEYLNDVPRSLVDGKSFSLAFEAGTVMHMHQHQWTIWNGEGGSPTCGILHKFVEGLWGLRGISSEALGFVSGWSIDTDLSVPCMH